MKFRIVKTFLYLIFFFSVGLYSQQEEKKNVRIAWQEVSGAATYYLRVRDVNKSTVAEITTTDTFATVKLANGKYDHKVIVRDKNGFIVAVSEWQELSIKFIRTPVLIEPRTLTFQKTVGSSNETPRRIVFKGKGFMEETKVSFISKKTNAEIDAYKVRFIDSETLEVELLPNNFEIGFYTLEFENPKEKIGKFDSFLEVKPAQFDSNTVAYEETPTDTKTDSKTDTKSGKENESKSGKQVSDSKDPSGKDHQQTPGVKKKSRWDIVWRSALLPGWGLYHAGDRISGVGVGILTLLAANNYFSANATVSSTRSSYESAAVLSLLTTSSSLNSILSINALNSYSTYQNSISGQRQALGILAAVYLGQLGYSYYRGIRYEREDLPKTGFQLNMFRENFLNQDFTVSSEQKWETSYYFRF